MSGITRDGDGMEPPKSTSDDELIDSAAEHHPDDAFSVVESDVEDAGENENDTADTVEGDATDAAEDALEDSADDSVDAAAAVKVRPGLDAEEDADLLTVEQWLAEVETNGDSAVGVTEAAESGSGQNMSDIMAELLAAAEESEADNEESEVDSEESETENENSEEEPVADDSDEADDLSEADDSDEETIDLDQVDAEESAIDLDALEAETKVEEKPAEADDETESESESGSGSGSEAKSEAETKSDPETKSEAEAKTEQPAPPVLPVKEATTGTGTETTTEVKTSKTAIIAPKTTEEPGSFPIIKVLVAAAVGLYALLALGWILDSLAHRGEAMRGVQIASADVGGADAEALGGTIDSLTTELSNRPLEVAIGDTKIDSNPVALGAKLDRQSLVDEALDAKRGGFLLFRPFIWVANLFSTETIEPRYIVDADVAATATSELLAPQLANPIEPTLGVEGNELVVNEGSPGVAIASQQIVDQLATEIDSGEPYQLQLTPLDSNPELETAAVTELADLLNRRTERPVSVRVLDDEAEVSPRTMKSWIEMTVENGEPGWTVNEEQALDDLKPLFPTLGSEDQQAAFTIVDGKPIILPAAESVVCCAEGSGDILRRIMKRPFPTPVTEQDEEGNDIEVDPLRVADLEPIITGNTEGVAELESLGIIEEVSTFTTKHACCQNRVKNIQRFADLMQGVIVRPGEELSLNGHVGQRTIDKGFVADGAIALGNFEKQVGGGISQYATTFFNASFFAGIEFLEYQSHSIYISRYPRGREATISWRRPDLKILNNTDYGILIWNEYTPTSITVTFYSTKHLEVEALDRRRSSDRKCRIDITPRLITYPDGTEVEDSVFALYRPGEGLDCNGDSTTPEEEPEPEPAPVTTPPPPEPETPPPGGGGEVVPPGEG